MSSRPSHSKSLHNFSFPEPKWNASSNSKASNGVNNEGQNHHSYSRRVCGSNSEQKRPERQQNEEVVAAFESPELETPKTESSQENVLEAKSPVAETPKPASSKILIRLTAKVPKPTEESSNATAVKEVKEKEKEREKEEKKEAEDSEQKTWNFRPRRASRGKKTNGEAPITRATGLPEVSKTPVSQKPVKNRSEGKSSEKKDKEKERIKFDFSLTLTREEIEEDLFLMTGSRPSRKPKRRPKSVQSRLDVCRSLNFDPIVMLLSFDFLGFQISKIFLRGLGFTPSPQIHTRSILTVERYQPESLCALHNGNGHHLPLRESEEAALGLLRLSLEVEAGRLQDLILIDHPKPSLVTGVFAEVPEFVRLVQTHISLVASVRELLLVYLQI
ncbi:Protein of unknown function DUF1639 [Dillenia turbinata]|uniref:Uncharacterized protein n=1 Tax=Dillenia turbinata TaxID=194707 RepID=A0AAN8V3N7_9MAGN